MPDLSLGAAVSRRQDTGLPHLSLVTLLAGCDFVSRHPVGFGASTALMSKVEARVTANRLRELDCFLAVLLSEVAAQIGGAGHDAEQFDRISNTSKKLLAIEALAGVAVTDHGRLRAMGRIAARMRRGRHHLKAASLMADLARAAGSGAVDNHADRALSHGKAVIPRTLNFAMISSFYHDLGGRLFKEIANKKDAP